MELGLTHAYIIIVKTRTCQYLLSQINFETTDPFSLATLQQLLRYNARKILSNSRTVAFHSWHALLSLLAYVHKDMLCSCRSQKEVVHFRSLGTRLRKRVLLVVSVRISESIYIFAECAGEGFSA